MKIIPFHGCFISYCCQCSKMWITSVGRLYVFLGHPMYWENWVKTVFLLKTQPGCSTSITLHSILTEPKVIYCPLSNLIDWPRLVQANQFQNQVGSCSGIWCIGVCHPFDYKLRNKISGCFLLIIILVLLLFHWYCLKFQTCRGCIFCTFW